MFLDIFLAIVASFLVLLTSLLLTHLIYPKSRVSILLSLFLFSSANAIFTAQLASLFSLLNSRWFFLGTHLTTLCIIFWLWSRNKRREDLGLLLKRIFSLPNELFGLLKRNPVYSVIFSIIIFATLFNAFIVLKVPPNTNDAMIQHLSRVGYWLQHGSMAPWVTPYVLQVVYPPNAQLQILWTVLFSGSDMFAGFIQWFAIPVSAVGIYGISTLLGWSSEKSILTAFLWMTLPQIVLQSTSTQNDLAVSGLIICGLYFLYYGHKNHDKKSMFLSSLSIAIAVGTKQSVFFILPALMVILVLFWVRSTIADRRLITTWLVSAVSFFILFGSYIYVQNMIHYKTPFGPSEVVSETVKNNDTGLIRNAVLKISRVVYQTFDVTEVPYRDYGPESRSMWLYNKTAEVKATIGKWVFSRLKLDLESPEGVENYPGNQFTYIPPAHIQEDITWFGPISFLVIIPSILVCLFKKPDKYTLGLFLLWVSFFLGLNFFKSGWTPNQSRYYVLSVTCTMPLVSVFWTGKWKRSINVFVLFLSILFMCLTIATNFSKPLIGGRSIWNKSRPELRGLQSREIRDSIVKINRAIPDGSTVGISMSGASFDYPFYGEHFTHKLIPAFPIEVMDDVNWLETNEICYLLVADETKAVPELPNLQIIESSPGWKLYRVQETTWCSY